MFCTNFVIKFPLGGRYCCGCGRPVIYDFELIYSPQHVAEWQRQDAVGTSPAFRGQIPPKLSVPLLAIKPPPEIVIPVSSVKNLQKSGLLRSRRALTNSRN